MPVLGLEELSIVRQHLDTYIRRDVTVTLYTTSSAGIIIPGRECAACGPVQELLEEVAGLSPKLTLETVDYYTNQVDARERGIARIPGFTVGRQDNSRMRYFGMPTQRQMPVLVSALIRAAERSSPLKLETRRRIRRLREDAHIQVFVTQDSEHCGDTAMAALAMAAESPKVTTDVIEVGTFPNLIDLHKIRGVPATVINGRVTFTGAMDEDLLLKQVLRATGEAEAGAEQIVDFSNEVTMLSLGTRRAGTPIG
ncbi:MAG: thioredoxin family protein [Chloroflexota bacterium]|nr:thioredoxin family protein [Chloroflexota bacterium]